MSLFCSSAWEGVRDSLYGVVLGPSACGSTDSILARARRHDAGSLHGAAFVPQGLPQAPGFAEQGCAEGRGGECEEESVCMCAMARWGDSPLLYLCCCNPLALALSLEMEQAEGSGQCL